MKKLSHKLNESFLNESKLVFQAEHDRMQKAHTHPSPLFSTNNDFNLDFSVLMNSFFNGDVDQKGYEAMWAKFNSHYNIGVSKAPKPSFFEDIMDTDESFTAKNLTDAIKKKAPMSKITGHDSLNESLNEAKIDGIDIGPALTKNDFGDKITDFSEMKKGSFYIYREAGLNQWIGDVKFEGVKGKDAILNVYDGPGNEPTWELTMSVNDVKSEIKDGFFYETI